MEYSFAPYLNELGNNWYEDDPLLQRLLAHYSPAAAESQRRLLSGWGATAADLLCRLAEVSARPENSPRLVHWDAYGRRVDGIVLPSSTREALAEAEGRQRLGAPHGDAFVFYAQSYLCWQNGEAGIACSMGCTDGLVRVLEALGDRPEHALAVRRVRGSTPERVWHGAQFVTEIHGGSDVGANTVRAVPAGDAFRIHGRKWFCSNINADYFLVTARPDGAPPGGKGVALFLVPALEEEDGWRRNGYTIDRLKDKLGTRELATAEVTFAGALAYPVGPLGSGLANLIRYVLVPSRFACVISAAAFLRQAERIACAYAGFRHAFGRPIAEFEPVRQTLDEIRQARTRSLATVLGLLNAWEQAPDDFRILLSLAKTVLTRQATRLLHEAIMVLGANGIEERFSPLPRLYRDAVIMETWEGPHNVLIAQALRDLRRLRVDAGEVVERLVGPGRESLALDLARVLQSAERADVAGGEPDLAALAEKLVLGFADRILREIAWHEQG